MIKENERFKDATTGKIYKVKIINDDTMIVEAEDGSDQRMSLNQDKPEFSNQN
jgi:hypothetical protein